MGLDEPTEATKQLVKGQKETAPDRKERECAILCSQMEQLDHLAQSHLWCEIKPQHESAEDEEHSQSLTCHMEYDYNET